MTDQDGRDSQPNWAAVIDALADGLAVFSPRQELTFWNRPFEKLFDEGTLSKGLTLRHVIDHLPQDVIQAAKLWPDLHLRKGKDLVAVQERLLSGGDRIEIRLEPLPDDKVLLRIVQIIRKSGHVVPTMPVNTNDADALVAFIMQRRDIAVCLYDKDDVVIAWNDAYWHLWPNEREVIHVGFSYRDSLRMWMESELEPSELPNIERHIAAGLERHRGRAAPFIYQCKDGRWILVQSLVLSDGRLLKTWVDVTAATAQQAALQSTAEMVVAATIGFSQFDDTGHFVIANKRLQDLFPESKTINRPEATYREHLDCYARYTLAEFERPRIDALIHRGDLALSLIHEPELYQTRDGRWLQFQERRPQEGGVASLWMDVTASIQKDAELAALRQQVVEAVRSMAEGFALYDADDRLILCNDRYRAVMDGPCAVGDTFEEILDVATAKGRFSFKNMTPESGRAGLLAQHQGSIQPLDLMLSDGTWIRILERRTSDGGVVSIITDITDSKRVEAEIRNAQQAADAANRAKSEFLANISHELRTPLNAIIGFGEILRAETFGRLGNPRYVDYSQDILDSGRLLLQMINDILDLSRIESGQFSLNEEELDLAMVARGVMRILQTRAERSAIQVNLDMPADLPPLFADARAMKQILLNLIGNAIKFSLAKGEVTITARRNLDWTLVVTTADNGIGIPPDKLQNVLLPFSQADQRLARRYEGTGLGLPLTNRLVQMHNGTLTLESEPNVGTKAIILFPASRVVGAPVEQHQKSALGPVDL